MMSLLKIITVFTLGEIFITLWCPLYILSNVLVESDRIFLLNSDDDTWKDLVENSEKWWDNRLNKVC